MNFCRGIGFARLQKTAHAHGLFVPGFMGKRFIELASGFAPEPELCTRQRSKNTVAGTVRKIFRFDFVKCLRRHLPALDGLDPAAVHDRILAGTVEQTGQIVLKFHLFIKNTVPDGIIRIVVPVKIFEPDLLYEPGLHPARRTADPHADLAGRIAAEHRTFMHENGFDSMPRRLNRRAHSCQTAADHAEVSLMFDCLHISSLS